MTPTNRMVEKRFLPTGMLFCLLCLGALCSQAQDTPTPVRWTAARPDGHAPIGVMIDHTHGKGEWMLSYRYMEQGMLGNRSGMASVSDGQLFQQYLMSPSRMRMGMHMGMAMYGLSSRLTLMAMFQVMVMRMDMQMMPNPTMQMPGMDMATMNPNMTSRSAGLGDTKLYALYNLFEWNRQRLFLSGGLSIPTGSIQRQGNSEDMYNHQRLPYGMQLGSGSLELLPGITYLGQQDHLSWGGQFTGTIRTHYNAVGYRWGNEAALTGWLAYRCNNWLSGSIRAEGAGSSGIRGNDPTLYPGMEPAANPHNSGGRRLSGYAGLNFYVRKGFFKGNRLAVEAGLPVSQRLNGVQMPIQSTLYAGWQRAF